MKFEQLRNNQRKAIDALLEGKTQEEAAEAAGVTRVTVWSWLKDPEVQGALLEQTRVIHRHVIARLVGSLDRAIDTLQAGCDGDANATQVRSATALIQNAVMLNEAIDQEARIQDALERLARLEAMDKKDGRTRAHTLPAVRTWPS